MADLPSQEIAEKLRVPAFARSGPSVAVASDPIADTPIIVTLDQLQPYKFDPRITKNPRYEEIKSSIRERGLDSPPAITRRPGETHFTIRNGGNTRLTILRELWTETKDEKFFRIACLFRPWPSRGEIIALTGHLCENELHGGLSFIEKALGIEKARELYEQELGQPLTQSELARRLAADGYPVTQPHISRMQDAVEHLLPAIPTVLYGGLGKPQVERLTALRKAAARAVEQYAPERSDIDFPTLFSAVLSRFDGDTAEFQVQRVQDELIGQLSEVLGIDYDTLALAIVDAEARQRALTREPREPMFHVKLSSQDSSAPLRLNLTNPIHQRAPTKTHSSQANTALSPSAPVSAPSVPPHTTTPESEVASPDSHTDPQLNDRVSAHIVSPAETTSRLQTIQQTIAEATGDPLPSFEANVVRAIPVQVGGLFPVSDVWYIAPALDAPERLRAHIAQLAAEIAQDADLAQCIEAIDEGIGYACTNPLQARAGTLSSFSRAVLNLLHALSCGYLRSRRSSIDAVRLVDDLAPLLQGAAPLRRTAAAVSRLSDTNVVKLFRLIRLARHLLERDSAAPESSER
jgi:ParB family protein of integrating conjugative element (PFGI_1 class)